MKDFISIFSTREIALMFWGVILLVLLSIRKSTRDSVLNVGKALFHKKLIFALCTLLLYACLIIVVLVYIRFFDISLFKDTVKWFLFSGIALFMEVKKADNKIYFLKQIKHQIRFIIIYEFLFNTYTLSLLGELIFIPIVYIFRFIVAFSPNTFTKEDDSKRIVTLIKYILIIIRIIMMCYVLYRTITGYELLLTTSNFKSLFLPVILLIMTIPYFYFLALYMNYDSLIGTVKNLHKNDDQEIIKGLIKAIFKYANINITVLKRIEEYHQHFCPSKDDPYEYIRNIANPKYIISDRAKLPMFNDIQTVIKALSDIGVGKLNDWHRFYDGEVCCYSSISNSYLFGVDDITKIPNTLAFNLSGEDTYINKLEIFLNIGHGQDQHLAIQQYMKVITQTFNILSIQLSHDLTNSIICSRKYDEQNRDYSVSLNYENLERIETYTLSIITKTIYDE